MCKKKTIHVIVYTSIVSGIPSNLGRYFLGIRRFMLQQFLINMHGFNSPLIPCNLSIIWDRIQESPSINFLWLPRLSLTSSLFRNHLVLLNYVRKGKLTFYLAPSLNSVSKTFIIDTFYFNISRFSLLCSY